MATTGRGEYIRSHWLQILIGFFMIVIAAIAIFRIGGDDFVYAFNSNISFFQSLTILVISVILWIKIGGKNQNRMLWMGLTFGWGLWTVAELWWGISSFFIEEAPFPSPADIFWLLGYIPMYIALDAPSRSIREEISTRQKLIIWLCSIIVFGLTAIFVLEPAIAEYEAGAFFETLLTLSYPICDVILLILVLRITFKYQSGINGAAWKWISGGYVLLTFADLIFVYASAKNLYYPNGQVNFISSIGSDLSYSESYMLIMLGLTLIRKKTVSNQVQTEQVQEISPVPNTHILFFTDLSDLVNDASKNYSRVFDQTSALGQPLARAAGMAVESAAALISKIKSKKVIPEEVVTINTRFGQMKAFLSGQTLSTPEGTYAGEILLFRLVLDDYSIDDLLSEYEKSLIRSVIKKAGVPEENEIKVLLTTYHTTLLKGFIDTIENEGGHVLGKSVSANLNLEIAKFGWQITIDSDGRISTGNLPLNEIKKILHDVITKARQITTEFTNEATVARVEKQTWTKLDPRVRGNLSQNGVTPPAS